MTNQNIQQKLDSNSVFIPECGCKIWLMSTKPNGYGQVAHEGKLHYAHRLAFSLANGEIPSGMSVLHSCDIPSCINPKHLRLGTQRDNVADMIHKARKASSQGERNGYSKLSTSQVMEIKKRIVDGEAASAIADAFIVSRALIKDIEAGRRWAHVVVTERRDFAREAMK